MTPIIENARSNNFIHPNSLTQGQYEELKQLIPTACKVRECYNNHCEIYRRPEDRTYITPEYVRGILERNHQAADRVDQARAEGRAPSAADLAEMANTIR